MWSWRVEHSCCWQRLVSCWSETTLTRRCAQMRYSSLTDTNCLSRRSLLSRRRAPACLAEGSLISLRALRLCEKQFYAKAPRRNGAMAQRSKDTKTQKIFKDYHRIGRLGSRRNRKSKTQARTSAF